MENKTLGIFLGIGLYLILCAVIAGVRALLSGRGEQGTRFCQTFWNFFREVLNPFHWF